MNYFVVGRQNPNASSLVSHIAQQKCATVHDTESERDTTQRTCRYIYIGRGSPIERKVPDFCNPSIENLCEGTENRGNSEAYVETFATFLPSSKESFPSNNFDLKFDQKRTCIHICKHHYYFKAIALDFIRNLT